MLTWCLPAIDRAQVTLLGVIIPNTPRIALDPRAKDSVEGMLSYGRAFPRLFAEAFQALFQDHRNRSLPSDTEAGHEQRSGIRELHDSMLKRIEQVTRGYIAPLRHPDNGAESVVAVTWSSVALGSAPSKPRRSAPCRTLPRLTRPAAVCVE